MDLAEIRLIRKVFVKMRGMEVFYTNLFVLQSVRALVQ
jgi:hypothetical protein